MEELKDYIKNHSYVDIIFIALLIILITLFFSTHFYYVFPDKGRELVLPVGILDGAVPYKDITLIYFPLAYYINALIYFVIGININSLLISQCGLCILLSIGFYKLANEFFSRSTTLLLTILVIFCSILGTNDLFNYLTPYSYARMYGFFGAFAGIFCIVRLFKTDKLKWAYYAALCIGFSCCCKLEFITTILILLTGLILYKKLKLSDYVKLLITFLIFPIFIISVLIIQGVTIQNLVDSFNFAIKFAQTEPMTEFLNNAGLYPYNIVNKITTGISGLKDIIIIILLCFMGLRLKQKYPKWLILSTFTILICIFCYNKISLWAYWIFMPYMVFIYLCTRFKTLLKEDKISLFLIIASLILGLREFFKYVVSFYAAFSFPILILTFFIIIFKTLPKEIYKVKLKYLVNFVFVILNLFYIYNICYKFLDTNYLIKTPKGSFYTTEIQGNLLENTLNFISKNTQEGETILVLPEGNIINFLSDRKVNLKCFMMDRLYHDAYGQEEARNQIANTNSDYIILLKGLKLSDFSRPYLYNKYESLSAKYIFENYNIINIIEKNNNFIYIYKKK